MMPSRGALARCAPFGIFIAMLMLGSVLPSPHVVLVRSILVALALAWFWRSYGELRRPSPARATHWLLAGSFGLAIFVAWIWLDHDWIVFGTWPGFDPRLPGGTIDWPVALLRLAGSALVVPIMEELFWRSFLLRWLERQDFLALAPGKVGARSFAITTLLFALEHNQWLAGAIAGAAYNALYIRSGNLWVPILAHVVTNGALGAWILATGSWQFW